jgi:nucleotide-binding universal stress UspA family protein
MKAKNILFATDFSDASQAALEYASSLAHDAGATLYIVHVGHFPVSCIDGAALGVTPFIVAPELDDWQEVRNQLGKIVPTIRDVRFEHRYLEGSPADEIVDFARRQNIDVIVIGTHGRTGLNHILMGSVAEAVIRRASCPVLTVKQPVSAATTNAVPSKELQFN